MSSSKISLKSLQERQLRKRTFAGTSKVDSCLSVGCKMATNYIRDLVDPSKKRESLMPEPEIAVGKDGWAMPRTFLKYREAIRIMEVRPTDIWVLSFPKCGTTWTQEMTWVIVNNCDLDSAKEQLLSKRFPFLERVQDAGLQPAYRDPQDRSVKEGVHQLISLAFVPPDDVEESFDLLREDLPDNLLVIADYFEATYIRGRKLRGQRRAARPLYRKDQWNQYVAAKDGEPRTNNLTEGWHRRFNTLVGKDHSSIFSLIKLLQKEQGNTQRQIDELEVGKIIRAPQKRQYRLVTERLERISARYQDEKEDGRILNYLKACGNNITLLSAIGLPKSDEQSTIDIVKNMPRDKPRFIKSHLAIELLPKDLFIVKPKIIYVSRDPRDAVVSFSHMRSLRNGAGENIDESFEDFLKDKVLFAPYWKHTLQYWGHRNAEHFLFLNYEEMKKDLRPHVRRVSEFLGKPIPEGMEDAVVNHLSFASMKDNTAVNYSEMFKPKQPGGAGFMRKGVAGSWKEVLSPEQVARVNAWSEKWIQDTQYPYFNPSL